MPTILCEIDCDIADANRSIITKYYYANAQILKQEQLAYGAAEIPGYYETVETCNENGLQECIADCLYYQWFGDTTSYAECNEYCRPYYCSTQQQWIPPVPMEVFVKPYFYVHDRLGSVRLLVNDIGDVNNSYTYNPFGEAIDYQQTTNNCFMFTGQWYDDEIGQYYLRARMYDPTLMRFSTRDPVKGKPKQPLTSHPYLYCIANPINSVDPSGEWSASALTDVVRAGYETHFSAIGVTAYGVSVGSNAMISLGIAMDQSVGFVMSIAAMSRHKGADDIKDMIDKHNQQNWDNQMGDLNFNMPQGWGKWTKLAVVVGVGALAIASEWADFIDMIKELKQQFDEWRNPEQWTPLPE